MRRGIMFKASRHRLVGQPCLGFLVEECPFAYGGDLRFYLWRWVFAVGVFW